MSRFLHFICLCQLVWSAALICDTERSTFQTCILDDAKTDAECLAEVTTYWACVTNNEDIEGIELCNRQYYDVFSFCAKNAGNCAQCGSLVNETEPADCGAANSNWCEGSWATCCKPCQYWADGYASCLNEGVCTPFPPEENKCTSSDGSLPLKIAAAFWSAVITIVVHFV